LTTTGGGREREREIVSKSSQFPLNFLHSPRQKTFPIQPKNLEHQQVFGFKCNRSISPPHPHQEEQRGERRERRRRLGPRGLPPPPPCRHYSTPLQAAITPLLFLDLHLFFLQLRLHANPVQIRSKSRSKTTNPQIHNPRVFTKHRESLPPQATLMAEEVRCGSITGGSGVKGTPSIQSLAGGGGLLVLRRLLPFLLSAGCHCRLLLLLGQRNWRKGLRWACHPATIHSRRKWY